MEKFPETLNPTSKTLIPGMPELSLTFARTEKEASLIPSQHHDSMVTIRLLFGPYQRGEIAQILLL